MSSSRTAPLRLPQIIALYIGAVLGCGILMLSGLAADLAGPASLVSWGIMAALVLPMALTMGLLSMKYPSNGGVSHFVSSAFNPQLGSLIGWFFLLSAVIAAPVMSLLGAGYFCTAYGLDDPWRIFISAIIMAAAIIMNYFGMKITGQIQIAVVMVTVIILIGVFIGGFRLIDPSNFHPFLPNGWISVGHATTLVFWCFIGWEAVSHISEEFENPGRDVIRATIIAAAVVSILYFLTALVVVGSHSYGPGISDVSLIYLIKSSFGEHGVILAGISALFICIAPTVAYIGAASRLANSLGENGYAPRFLARTSSRYHTPVGGLVFLACSFVLVLLIFNTGILSLTTLIQIPNATFIVTYIGGCAAGLILLKGDRIGQLMSGISLLLSIVVFFFASWAIIYPLVITIIWGIYLLVSKKKIQKNVQPDKNAINLKCPDFKY